ncbi:MAG: chromate efflux transporter [Sediminibacterium sp.]|nr:chromate efflux transporter [Sediminibacterium sp.]
MKYLRHISFLKAVLQHSLTAFGGPQVAMALMQYRFVEKRRDLTAQELVEYSAFCQLLPGASSTQTIVLVGFKRGGVVLALLTLLVWMLPAVCIMTCLALLVSYFSWSGEIKALSLLQPMSIGFIFSAALLLFQKSVNSIITRWIFVITAIITFIGFNTPWTIPTIIILAGVVTNFSDKRIPTDGTAPKSIQWRALVLFVLLFIAAGFLSERATKQNWESRKLFNLFENNYRFGSMVFGGGDVLIPIMYEQFVTRPASKRIQENKRDVVKIDRANFLTGTGLVRAVPGPIFSISSYMGAMALKDKSMSTQLYGALVASLGIFLPSFLIVLFFFPIWQYLKKYAIFYRSLEGVYAAIVGIMIGASLYLIKDIAVDLRSASVVSVSMYVVIFFSSTYLLYKQKLAPQWIAFSCIVIGLLMSGWF